MERRGLRSEIAERIRERYRARVQARLARAAGHTGAQPSPPGLDLEQLRQQAREAWLQLRGRAPEGLDAGRRQAHIKESPAGGQLLPQTSPETQAPRRASLTALERDAADRDFAL
jgi:hypothetical protein